ncbi:MAG: chorismate-binding protein, partial [Muribaculaceae bacterium]|nr:chorismate-binding protein [Muribaculaceae bacterium]
VQRLYPLPVRSTSKEDHLENVAAMVSYLCQGEKAICCAAICGNRPIHLADSLISLGTSFPDAMVFCFFTPQSGLWIGASPELLLQKSDDSLFTMALAGTRLADTQKAWDEKNIEEQKMVANYIASLLEKNNLIFDRDEEPSTKKSGSIEHLCTSFHIHAPAKVDSQWLTSFLHDFSPTPALCGFPKEKAYDMIGRIENFSRGYYGGFFGPFSPDGDFSLFVLLRALRVENDKWCMFAGGGITSASEPEKEWIETRNKADSVISKLSFMD